MLRRQPGQCMVAEVCELFDDLFCSSQPFSELAVLGLEPIDLRDLRVGDLSGFLQALKTVLELDAQVCVGAVAVEGGAVDGGLLSEGLDVAVPLRNSSVKSGSRYLTSTCGFGVRRTARLTFTSRPVPANRARADR